MRKVMNAEAQQYRAMNEKLRETLRQCGVEPEDKNGVSQEKVFKSKLKQPKLRGKKKRIKVTVHKPPAPKKMHQQSLDAFKAIQEAYDRTHGLGPSQ